MSPAKRQLIMKHLVLIGACYLDTILSVPSFPEEDSKLRAKSLQIRRGGNCPNSLEVLQQLLAHRPARPPGVLAHLVSCLPAVDSPAAAKIFSSFGLASGAAAVSSSPSVPWPAGNGPEEARDEEGGRYKERKQAAATVDLGRCLYREGHPEPASSYVIRSESSGSRTIVNFNDLPEMTEDEFAAVVDTFREEETGEEESLWHFEGRIPETTLACIRYLRRVLPKARVSVEVEKPGREGLRELAAEADIVFYSRSWAEQRGYRTAEACLRGELPPRASLIFCTWGAGGAAALSPGTREFAAWAATVAGQGVKVVDTIGAGDTFVAAILFGVLCHQDDWGLEQKLRFAVDLATKKVQIDGFAGLVTM